MAGEPLPTLLTITPYVHWVVRVLRKAADGERTTLHAGRLPGAVTIPATVVRHQCPHCHRTWAKKSADASHVARCWSNPGVKSCKTCKHHKPGEAASGCWNDPYCNCPEIPESCALGAADPVITGCTLWQLSST